MYQPPDPKSLMKFHLQCPGLFITATDTEVGKTIITGAIATLLRRAGRRVGVCKPIATDCSMEHGQLVSADGQALAQCAQSGHLPTQITPIRYAQPLAPAVAAERSGQPVDFQNIDQALQSIDADSEVMLIEGIGGLMVPLDRSKTVLDLAVAIGYPVLVVTRADLGTLNHTALTCRLIHQAGLPLVGLVINRFDATSADVSVADNPKWLALQNQTRVLATVERCDAVTAEDGSLAEPILKAMAGVDWSSICKIQQ